MISVITVNYKQAALTCDMLRSLRQSVLPDGESLEVIVVDNAATTDHTADYEAAFPEVRVFNCVENLGFAGANNLGIRHAAGEVLFLLNNDTELAPDTVAVLAARLQQGGVGVVSPKIIYHGTDQIQYAGFTRVHPLTGRNVAIGKHEHDRGQHNTPARTAYAHGAAMMLRREVVERCGPMPEAFFLYYEELDWCETIRREGYEIWYEPAATVWHKASASTGRESPLQTYYLTRNRLHLMRRHHGWASFAVFSVYFGLVSCMKIVSLRLKGKASLARAMGRGLWDGWRGVTGFRAMT